MRTRTICWISDWNFFICLARRSVGGQEAISTLFLLPIPARRQVKDKAGQRASTGKSSRNTLRAIGTHRNRCSKASKERRESGENHPIQACEFTACRLMSHRRPQPTLSRFPSIASLRGPRTMVHPGFTLLKVSPAPDVPSASATLLQE